MKELSRRDKETLQLLAEGHSAKQIAAVFAVRAETVESTLQRMMEKLGANSLADLVELAGYEGVIDQREQSDPRAATSSIPLLTTKLHRPAITADILTRTRLIDQLNAGLERTWTLISAPAGYGKSILASRWLEGCDCPVSWVSLDDNDNDLRITAVQTLCFSGPVSN